MNLSGLNDSTLLSEMKNIARQELDLLSKALHHLREINRRRLFSTLRYKSLFDYAVKELGYSEDQAYRRITAMKLLVELPQIEAKITEGALTLSNIGIAASAFRAKSKELGRKVDSSAKLEVLTAIAGKSKKEAQQIVLAKIELPKESLGPETVRSLACGTEIKIIGSPFLEEKVQRLKGLMAHSNPQISTGELFEKLCDEALERHQRQMTKIRAAKKHRVTPIPLNTPTKREALSVTIRKQNWIRSKGKCQNCGSIYALQADHIHPVAKGGQNYPDNLRLLCRSCNQRAAIEKLGLIKMQRYLERDLVT